MAYAYNQEDIPDTSKLQPIVVPDLPEAHVAIMDDLEHGDLLVDFEVEDFMEIASPDSFAVPNPDHDIDSMAAEPTAFVADIFSNFMGSVDEEPNVASSISLDDVVKQDSFLEDKHFDSEYDHNDWSDNTPTDFALLNE